ncbi:MAG: wax ester/triacylglycerol synthase domain-containing protein, partial [Acidimicrobiales bacterium]
MDHSIDQHITETDALMVQLERDPVMRSTIVSVALLDRAPQWATVVDRLERATRLVPAMRQKLVPSLLRLAPPHWVVDPGFDLAHHVRRVRLPDGGGLGEVLEWGETTATAAFDPERPLWELTLFEGLDEDRAATVLKMHHVLMDGVGGLAVLLHVLDTQREPAIRPGASPVVPSGSVPNAFETMVDLARYDTARAVRTGSGLLRSLPRGIGRSVHDPAGA